MPLVLSLTKAWFCLFYLPPSTQVFTYIYHISPGPSLLAKQSQISQPPKLQMHQSLHHLHGLSLSLFQCVHISLILQSSDLDPAVQVCLTRAEQRGRITSINLPAVLFLMHPSHICCKAALPAHVQVVECQGPQGLLCKSCFLAASPPVLLQMLF